MDKALYVAFAVVLFALGISIGGIGGHYHGVATTLTTVFQPDPKLELLNQQLNNCKGVKC